MVSSIFHNRLFDTCEDEGPEEQEEEELDGINKKHGLKEIKKMK